MKLSTSTRAGTLPVLFCLWPILNFANENREQLNHDGVLVLVGVIVAGSAIALLLYVALNLITRRRRSIAVGFAVAAFTVFFFNYHLIYDALVVLYTNMGVNTGENFAYLAIVLASCLAFLRFGQKERLLAPLLMFAFMVNLVPAAPLLAYAFAPSSEGFAPSSASEQSSGDLLTKPDIIHLITDAYGGADVLADTVGFDNDRFLKALEARGFYVAREARANYPMTFLSISSTVASEYLVTERTPRFNTRAGFYKLIRGNNPVVSLLRHQGYRVAYQGSVHWDGSRCIGLEDVCLSTARAFQQSLLYLTPLRRFFRGNEASTVQDLVGKIDTILDADGPVYLFSHTMAPHPPRTFDKHCARLTQRIETTTDYWEDKAGYAGDLGCVNQQILAFIDKVIERSPDAIVLWNGDHGPAFGVDWSLPIDQWSEAQFKTRFSILMAIRLPTKCQRYAYASLSPVNAYPLIFACLSGRPPIYKPDISFVSPKEKHPQYGTAYPHLRTEQRDRHGNTSD